MKWNAKGKSECDEVELRSNDKSKGLASRNIPDKDFIDFFSNERPFNIMDWGDPISASSLIENMTTTISEGLKINSKLLTIGIEGSYSSFKNSYYTKLL